MAMASKMAPLYSLHQDNRNEVQHELFGHVIQLMSASASYITENIINDTFATPGQCNQNEVQHNVLVM